MSLTYTVVIPTYNQADYLQGALTSVLNQTFENFEIIVVDNYSQDHTLEVINRVADNRIRLISFNNDGVIAASRNIGINESSGTYIAFLDSDDLWLPTKLSTIYKTIQAEPQHCVYTHDYEIVTSNGNRKYVKSRPNLGSKLDLYTYLLMKGNTLSTSATIVRRDALSHTGGFSESPDLITVEDYDLWMKLSKFGTFKFLDQNLGSILRHSTNASANVELHLQNTIHLFNMHLNIFNQDQYNKSSSEAAWRRADIIYGSGRQYHHQNKLKLAISSYIRAIKIYPFHMKTYAGALALLPKLFSKPPKCKAG